MPRVFKHPQKLGRSLVEHARKLRAALAVLVIGLGLTVVATAWQSRRNDAEAREALEQLSGDLTTRMNLRLRTYEYGLRGLRGAWVASDTFTLQHFRDYSATRDLAHEFPGARGFGLVQRVEEEDEARFAEEVRNDGWPAFVVHALGRHDGPRYVIRFVTPVEENLSALGLDMASEPVRRSAADQAARTGSATLTAPITLVQSLDEPFGGALLFLPVYRPGAPTGSDQEREAALLGWTYVPLSVSQVLGDIVVDPRFAFALEDRAAAGTTPLFKTPDFDGQPSSVATTASLSVFGRQWEASLRPKPRLLRELHLRSPSAVALSGTALAILFAYVAHVLALAERRRQERLAEQRRRAAIVEGSADAIVGESLEGTITDFNRAAERMFGISAQEAIGRHAAELLAPTERREEDDDLRARASSAAWIAPFDSTRRRRDGSTFEVSVTASPIYNPRGCCVGLSTTLRDVSETRTAQRDLARLNARLEEKVAERTACLDLALHDLRSIVDALPSLIGYWTKDLKNRMANRAYADWFGSTADDLYGKSMVEVLGGLYESTRPFVDAVLRGEPQRFERRLLRKDGSARHTLTHLLPDVQDGQVQGFYVLVHDVTEIVESRNKLAATSSLLESVLAAASELSIIATDADGIITVFNAGAERMLGYTSEEMIGRVSPALLHEPAEMAQRSVELEAEHGVPVEGFQVFVHNPLRDRRPESREWTYVRKDGARVPIVLTATAMRDENGALFGYLGIGRDVTLQKEQDRSLRAAVEEAHRANRAKSQFLANMSHEIRTPLNAVIGLSYLLERTTLDPQQSTFLDKIKLASKSLLAIINDILDLSKIEASELKIERAPFHLATVLHEVRELAGVQADARGIAFDAVCEGVVPQTLIGDPVRVHQMLVNLTSNAIKFTARGSVGLSVRMVEGTASGARLRFTVSDTGIGIAPEALERLFTPFVQADSSTTRRFGGTGLGLSIVKQLATLMGGEVGVTSRLGEGSAFWFELPFEIASHVPSVELVPVSLQTGRRLAGVRVLVADDSEINLEVARRVLESEGAAVVLANNGQEAVDYLLANPAGVDIVLMDLQMPVLDGFDATRRIRSGLGLTRLPIVALTAGTLSSDQQQAEAVGMTDFITKPFTPPGLVGCIEQHLVIERGSRPEEPAAEPRLVPEGWPELDGVDAVDVADRLGGDVSLFVRMMRQFVRTSIDVERAVVTDEASREGLARRLHKLKGSAVTLGAEAIARDASEGEAACREHDDVRLERAMATLADRLERLRGAAAELQDPAEPQGSIPPCSSSPVDFDRLSGLIRMLNARDMRALDHFAAMAAELRPRLGGRAYTAVREQIDELRFREAADALSGISRTPSLHASHGPS